MTKKKPLMPMYWAFMDAPRCGAKTRKATPCKSPAMKNGRCRMHGGMSTGAPKGNKNAFKHGRYSGGGRRTPRRQGPDPGVKSPDEGILARAIWSLVLLTTVGRGCHPEAGAYCESFNARFRDELLNGEIFYTLKEAQMTIEEWRKHYNTKRPHCALGCCPLAPETVTPMATRPVMH